MKHRIIDGQEFYITGRSFGRMKCSCGYVLTVEWPAGEDRSEAVKIVKQAMDAHLKRNRSARSIWQRFVDWLEDSDPLSANGSDVGSEREPERSAKPYDPNVYETPDPYREFKGDSK